MKKKVIGASRLRRKLNRLPEEIKKEVVSTIEQSAQTTLANMKAAVPVSNDEDLKDYKGRPRGHLRDALRYRIAKNGLRATVGLMGKKDRKVFFYARFLEFGTKKMPARSFIYKPWEAIRDNVSGSLRSATEKAFRLVAESRPSDE